MSKQYDLIRRGDVISTNTVDAIRSRISSGYGHLHQPKVVADILDRRADTILVTDRGIVVSDIYKRLILATSNRSHSGAPIDNLVDTLQVAHAAETYQFVTTGERMRSFQIALGRAGLTRIGNVDSAVNLFRGHYGTVGFMPDYDGRLVVVNDERAPRPGYRQQVWAPLPQQYQLE